MMYILAIVRVQSIRDNLLRPYIGLGQATLRMECLMFKLYLMMFPPIEKFAVPTSLMLLWQ
jgi:hypothetical protein